MDIFFEIHTGLPREAPGDDSSTLQALRLMTDLPPQPLILDIGCGPGAQTLALARQTGGRLIAVDNHAPFLFHLQQQVHTHGFENKINPVLASMVSLPFLSGSFDCIWSEGAIYIMGLGKGLMEWKQLLKPGGWVALTELTWLKANPPGEVHSYWSTEYPGMHNVSQNLEIIRAAGYQVVSHFNLPTSSWWNDYYGPLEKRLPGLGQKYCDNDEAVVALRATATEIEMYRKYSDYYGYVFYVMQVE